MIDSIANYLFDLGKVIVPIAISAVIGNYLVQRWQQRNWRQQQLVLRGEKNIDALKLAIDDLMNLADSRSYRSRRLLLQLRPDQPALGDSELFDEILKDYIKSVVAWNDKFNSLCVRLTMYSKSCHSNNLEKNIQPQFVEISHRIEQLLKGVNYSKHFFDKEKRSIDACFNWLNGSTSELYKALIRDLKSRERKNYLGSQIQFEKDTLEQFSTWHLTKALFKPNQPSLTVFSSLENLG